jgi:FkbM family methyltransferase
MAINHKLGKQELDFVNYIRQTVNKESICFFDVGTNRGLYVDLFLNFPKSVDIHCFEPNLDLHEQLSKKYGNKIVLNDIGVSDKKGEIEFYELLNPEIDGCSSLIERPVFKEKNWDYNIKKIQVDSIDNYFLSNNIEHIDFLKIDVEGAELLVLKGCDSLLTNSKISYIQFEYGKTFDDANITLQELYDFACEKKYGMYFFKDSTFLEVTASNIDIYSKIPYCDFILKIKE